MKWAWVAVVVLVSALVLILARADDPPEGEAADKGDLATTAAESPPEPAAGPLLEAAAPAERPREAAESAAAASKPLAEQTPKPRETFTPVRALEPPKEKEQEAAAKKQSGGPTLKPGETFTPVTALELPTKEEHEAAAATTRKRLQEIRPMRATWNDVPLQDVLRQLSKESGLILALGPRALVRGPKIRVTDPLAKSAPPLDPTVWNLLAALAKEHGFALNPWKKGVLLTQPPDPKEVSLRYYDARDLLQLEWGNKKDTDAEDRLAAVLPDLVSEAAKLSARPDVQVRGGTLIARQSREALGRIGKALEAWRADPKKFKQAYSALIAKRHPTVSGAPPRKDAPDGPDAPTAKDDASKAGK